MGWEWGVRNANLVLGSHALSLSGGGGVPPEVPLLWPHWGLAREGQRGSQDISNLQLVLHKSLQFLSDQLCTLGGCSLQTLPLGFQQGLPLGRH